MQPFFFNFLFLVIQSFFQFSIFGDPIFFFNSLFLVIQPFFPISYFWLSPVVRLQVQLNTRWKSCKKVFSECKKLEDRALGYVARFPNILDMMTILLLYLRRIVWQGFRISWIEGQFFYFTLLELRCKTSELGLRKKLKVDEVQYVIKSDNHQIRRIR